MESFWITEPPIIGNNILPPRGKLPIKKDEFLIEEIC
jgi:hypothetical protein